MLYVQIVVIGRTYWLYYYKCFAWCGGKQNDHLANPKERLYIKEGSRLFSKQNEKGQMFIGTVAMKASNSVRWRKLRKVYKMMDVARLWKWH